MGSIFILHPLVRVLHLRLFSKIRVWVKPYPNCFLTISKQTDMKKGARLGRLVGMIVNQGRSTVDGNFSFVNPYKCSRTSSATRVALTRRAFAPHFIINTPIYVYAQPSMHSKWHNSRCKIPKSANSNSARFLFDSNSAFVDRSFFQ